MLVLTALSSIDINSSQKSKRGKKKDYTKLQIIKLQVKFIQMERQMCPTLVLNPITKDNLYCNRLSLQYNFPCIQKNLKHLGHNSIDADTSNF